ncbi:MAG: hypothetical protein HOW73_37520, partial [Polyangiaceae bacterium]|nr:hypothetical protein [Polyangiaceae bacterium]
MLVPHCGALSAFAAAIVAAWTSIHQGHLPAPRPAPFTMAGIRTRAKGAMRESSVDPRIEALRAQLGTTRFFRFIASMPVRGERLHFWQSRESDILEERDGIAFPRDPAALTTLLGPFLPAHPSLPADRLPAWVVLEELGGGAPVQAVGRITGPHARFYFRARHDSWSISISADPEVDPVDVGGTEGAYFYHEEDFGYVADEASYMPLDTARFFIVRELSRWRESRVDGG